MKKILFISLALIFMSLAGCDYLPFGYTTIKEISRNPASFEGKELKIKGTVSGVLKIPFVEVKLFTVKDDSVEIAVITDGALPGTGQPIALKAVVDNTAIVGGESFGLKLRETKRL